MYGIWNMEHDNNMHCFVCCLDFHCIFSITFGQNKLCGQTYTNIKLHIEHLKCSFIMLICIFRCFAWKKKFMLEFQSSRSWTDNWNFVCIFIFYFSFIFFLDIINVIHNCDMWKLLTHIVRTHNTESPK